ncbi:MULTISPECIES: acetaldehyde dehydrogenase (acetylating) [Calothrix]|uniref:Acetaldehyde dehydrogenase n=2 Tax=Calothrix TaxID=1186 RepID=A0ABR8A707_9CYAN|nr:MULTISPECIES: acetaldehyde dehydrogenase (acetylating) [Calothrix]MBD2195786.1 acetaldehyde dehydrogenase (acetylating) [Calothrix parietina FACHB-288]MBD2224442.1 acetaldehyde dehydrogenase (acetylating) [Calothrix anomala FACHB-343]
MKSQPLRVAILGAGYIGTDLLIKIQRSLHLQCVLVVGRNQVSAGLRRALKMGYSITDGGIAALVDQSHTFDLVFDATDAHSHQEHWNQLKPLGKVMINLTPSRSGHMIAPSINGDEILNHANISLISCGGQASVPIVNALSGLFPSIPYIEVVTTAASPSVGRGTRLNLDEYIEITEIAISTFSKASQVKAIVNLSPAKPPPIFRVAISMMTDEADPTTVKAAVRKAAAQVVTFVPGYHITACEVFKSGQVFVAVEVQGRGDYLPSYAGNLDIINAAAIMVAERYATRAAASCQ